MRLCGSSCPLELGREPRPDDLLGEFGGDHPRAERQNLGVVAFARPLRRIGVVRLAARTPRDLIGGDRHTDARTADEDAAFQTPFDDVFGEPVGHIGVIVVGFVAVIVDGVAAPLEVRLDHLFKCGPRVVRAEGDRGRSDTGRGVGRHHVTTRATNHITVAPVS